MSIATTSIGATIRSRIDDILTCIAFFTRLRLPDGRWAERDFAGAIWAAPLVGVLPALSAIAILTLASLLGLPILPSAILAAGAMLLLTGGLHEDGFADIADGFGGGRTISRKIEIMQDSRIGTYGVCALVLALAFRISLIAHLVAADFAFASLAILAAAVASRATMPLMMSDLAPARQDGLASGIGKVSRSVAMIALLIGLCSLLLLGFKAALVAVVALAIVYSTMRWLTRSQINGYTGDVLGGLQIVSEIAILLLATSYLG